MSGNAVSVVELPELPSTDPPPVELLEVVDELPLVEVDSPELVSAGKVVTPGVVKLVEDPPGLLHPTRSPNEVATARRSIRAKSNALLPGSQARPCPLRDSLDASRFTDDEPLLRDHEPNLGPVG